MLTEILCILLTIRWTNAIEANCSLKFSDINYSISTVICPAGCWRQNHELCGTRTYGDGPVCLAGIHAGVISDCGGVAHVYETVGFTSSEGSLSYSVRTSTCGPKKKAYTFEMTCNTIGNSEFDITKVVCPSNCQSNYVCGSDFYTFNSSVCAAAIHAGVTGTEGGKFKFYKRQGQSSHAGTTNHGIETSTCGSTNISFNFIKIDDCLSNPCQNLGTCVDLVADYVCICTIEYEGKNCGLQKMLPTTCASANKDGVQPLRSGDSAYCSNGWRVIQRRFNGQVIFHNRTWVEYKNGFGNLSTEFWIGLDKIHRLTSNGGCRLRIELGDYNNSQAFAEYSNFSVGNESDLFRLHIYGHNGTAGDSFNHDGQDLNNMPFSTVDRDNDKSSSHHCAVEEGGGWWHRTCGRAKLNGRWGKNLGGDGIIWYSWKEWINLNSSMMMIRCN